MGKFANFFKKIGRGIKKGATKVWDWTKKAVEKVGKIARPLADVASKVGGTMSMLPGKAGAIGTGLAAGGSAIKSITDMLPDSQAKTKINEAIDKGLDTGQGYLNKGIGFMNDINNKALPWINAGVNISNAIADGADKLHSRMPNKLPALSKQISINTVGGNRGFNPYKMTPEQRAAYDKRRQEQQNLRRQVLAEAQSKLPKGMLI